MIQPHNPVLLAEVLKTLNVKDGGIYVDGTFGAGGYTNEILKSADCEVYGIDKDISSFQYLKNIDKNLQQKLHFIHGDFANINDLLYKRKVFNINGIVLDIGVSSMQLDQAERGFSFMRDGKLDMRMNQSQDFSAFDVVNYYPESKLQNIIFHYGEERNAKKIAASIVNARKIALIESTLQLAKIISEAASNKRGKIHPATKTFQAIRIEVNQELESLRSGLEHATQILAVGGVLCVVTFHSLEDEIVKKYFANICKKKVKFNKYKMHLSEESGKESFINIYKKPIEPSRAEIAANPRARSAKLRALMRIE